VTSIQGVLTNNIKLEHKGTYTVHGCQSGYTAKMKLHASGMFSSKSKLHEASPLPLNLLQHHEGTLLIICRMHGRPSGT